MVIKILKSKLFSAVIIAGIGWLSLSFVRIKMHEGMVNKEVGNIETKISNLEKSNSSLERFISYIKHPSFMEKEARIQLNYKAEGEEVVFVYPDTSAKAGSESDDFRKQLAQMPNYLKWMYYLLGY
jgi:uncharacterized protein YeeX (DUF496 family)